MNWNDAFGVAAIALGWWLSMRFVLLPIAIPIALIAGAVKKY